MFICCFELFFWAMALNFGVYKLGAVDMGGSVYIHSFGAYFGLGCSAMLTDKKRVKKDARFEDGNYES